MFLYLDIIAVFERKTPDISEQGQRAQRTSLFSCRLDYSQAT
jgi:hypothetical protein